MSHFQRKRSGVFEMRQMILRERMAQSIVRPFGDASGHTRRVQLLLEIVRRDFA
jgi:hypothetical protein